MSQNSTTKIGQIGEMVALKYLQKNHYKILDRNFYIASRLTNKKIGEIDIIARYKKIYVFIEVKSKTKIGRPLVPLEAKINSPKKKRLIRVAENWLKKHKLPLTTPRQIDIIIITLDLNQKKAYLKHYKNAIEDFNFK